jgi:hypothetical protein
LEKHNDEAIRTAKELLQLKNGREYRNYKGIIWSMAPQMQKQKQREWTQKGN